MTETPSKREQLRQERRQQILDAALAVFAQKGFHGANVSDVAAHAGVSQGTIYWYFASKDELLEAAIQSFSDGVGQEILIAVEQCPTASGKLRALARTMDELVTAAGGLFTLFLEYWASSSRREEAGQPYADALIQYKDVIVELIGEGVRNGEFKPVDAEPLAWAMMAAYDGLAAYIMLMPDLDLGRVSQVFVETILSGLQIDKPEVGRSG